MAIGFRALVLDDDESTQRYTLLALRQHGFHCDSASRVSEAEELLNQWQYDAVITELTLPEINGYSLILKLIGMEHRPIIVVYTDVVEARITKDLLVRGVDDFLAKPVKGTFLAGKIRALIERRDEQANSFPATVTKAVPQSESSQPALPAKESDEGLPISLTRLNSRLTGIASVLPVSDAALAVFDMTRGCDWEVSQIAAAIQRDASLTADVLRLANSPLYNVGGIRVVRLDDAVMRIGQNRVGELALATSAQAGLTAGILPWLDLKVTWKRSMAAGLAMESLIEAGGHEKVGDGLLLSAIMYPLGRVALGMLCPQEYEEMVTMSQESGETLQDQERRALPTSHVQVMAHLLAIWNIPPEVFLPLRFASDDYTSLVRLAEPLRTRIELVKVAVFLGRLAAGNWHRWDSVDLPLPRMLNRLRIDNVMAILTQTTADLAKLAAFSPHHATVETDEGPRPIIQSVPYWSSTRPEQDLLIPLLSSCGFRPEICDAEDLDRVPTVSIMNCMSASREVGSDCVGRRIIVTDQDKVEDLDQTTTLAFPNSYGHLQDALTKSISDQQIAKSGRASWISKITGKKQKALNIRGKG